MTETSRASELIERLATFGDPRKTWKWYQRNPDYVQLFALKERDVPQLLAVARQWTEGEDDWSDDQEGWAVYAPVNAWRSLAQLKATEAVPVLLEMMVAMDERGDDWHLEEFPYVFAMIGPETLPALITFLSNDTHNEYARVCVAHSLREVAQFHSTARDLVVEALEAQLRGYDHNTEALNAFLVSYLLDLKAVESAEVIERAYAADRVDTTVVGNWNKVRNELGVEGLGLVPEELAGRVVDLFHLIAGGRDTHVHQEIGIRPLHKLKRKKRKIERQNRKRARQRRK